MCGRYQFTDDSGYEEIERIAAEIDNRYGKDAFKGGEIFPTTAAPVLLEQKGELRADLVKWGFPHFASKDVIINARSETVSEKRMFSKSFERRRCVIPASGFFEWKKTEDKPKKDKFLFTFPKQPIYMAGLWGEFDGEERFVILTTAANASMKSVHHRMPVILSSDKLEAWAFDLQSAQLLLKAEMPQLDKVMV